MNSPRPDFIYLDVRPLIEIGHPPFQKIMETVASLPEGVGLRLIVPFNPTPLTLFIAGKGFDHESREMSDGSWQIEFKAS